MDSIAPSPADEAAVARALEELNALELLSIEDDDEDNLEDEDEQAIELSEAQLWGARSSEEWLAEGPIERYPLLALAVAAASGHAELARAAIAQGADPLSEHGGDEALLCYALQLEESHPGRDATLESLIALCAPPGNQPCCAAALFAAVVIGREDLALDLASRCDPLETVMFGLNSLQACAKFGRLGALRGLIEALGDRLSEERARMALDVAAGHGQAAACQALLPLCPDRAPEPGELTLLMLAAYSGDEATTRLFASFESANERDPSGRTALARAASRGFASIIEILAPLTASDLRDRRGKTPLMLAAGSARAEATRALLPFSNPLAVDEKGRSALMLACQVDNDQEQDAAAECVKALAPLSDIELTDDEIKSALLIAIRADNPKAVRELVAAGAALGPALDGWTPLMIAARGNRAACAAELANASDLNQPLTPDNDEDPHLAGATAASLALSKNHFSVLTALLPRLDVFSKTPGGSILALAFEQEPSKARSRFLDEALAAQAGKAPPTDCSSELFGPLCRGHKGWVDFLFPRSDLTRLSHRHKSSLLMAAAYGSPERVAELLPLNDPSLINRQGMTALMWAAASGRLEAVQALLPLSDTSVANLQDRNTALGLAVAANQPECAQALLPHSDPRWRNREGQTPFLLACQQGSEALIALLAPFAQGAAEVDLRGRDAFSALMSSPSLSRSHHKSAERWRAAERLLPLVARALRLPMDHPMALSLPERLLALGPPGDNDRSAEANAQALARSALESALLDQEARANELAPSASARRL